MPPIRWFLIPTEVILSMLAESSFSSLRQWGNGELYSTDLPNVVKMDKYGFNPPITFPQHLINFRLLWSYSHRKVKFICVSTWYGQHSADPMNLNENLVASYWLREWLENCGEADRNGGKWGTPNYIDIFLLQVIDFTLVYLSEPNYNGVDQWGVMSGTYQEGSQNGDKELYLRGIRQRRWGQNNSSTLHRWVL